MPFLIPVAGAALGLGAGAALGATGIGLLGAGALGLGVGSTIAGSMEQADKLEKAGKIEEANNLREWALQKQMWDETAPARRTAQQEADLKLAQEKILYPMYTKETMATYPSTMDLLRKDVLREPGTSALFKEGVGNIAAGLAPYGVSPKGSAFGRMYTDLLARDIESTRQGRFQIAGYGTQPTTTGYSPTMGMGEAGQMAGYAGQSGSQYANLLTQQGANIGGMYGTLGQTAVQMPMYMSMLNYLNKKVV